MSATATINAEQLLQSIDPASLTYEEWVNAGKACKSEGQPLEVWDRWSAADPRYKPGECESKWNSFNGTGITVGTLVKMAQDRGWTHSKHLDWRSTIGTHEKAEKMTPSEQLAAYISAVFEPGEIVAFNVDHGKDKDKIRPTGCGVYTKTAQQIMDMVADTSPMESLHTDDAAGAWIRINPFDGEGIKDANVTSYRHTLIESDVLTIEEQRRLYKKLNLPISAMVHSGGKSVHAIVKIQAANKNEYIERVKFLHEYCSTHGLDVDTANKNPSRLSRMPGVTRNGAMQRLMALNTGAASWDEWHAQVNGAMWHPTDIAAAPPPSPPIFRNGPKAGGMGLFTAGDGIGKSWIILDLLLSCATGRRFNINTISHEGEPIRVCYVAYEDDAEELRPRLDKICAAANVNVDVWKRAQAQGLLSIFCDPPELATQRANDLPVATAALDELEKYITTHSIQLMVIDPLSAAAGLQNEDNPSLNHFAKMIRAMAKRTHCAAILIHHPSKAARGSLAHDSARGGGSLVSACRWTLNLVLKGDDHMNLEMAVSKNSYGPKVGNINLTRADDGVIRELTGKEIAMTRDDLLHGVVEFIKKNPSLIINPAAVARRNSPTAKTLIAELNSTAKDVSAAITAGLTSGILRTEQRTRGNRVVSTCIALSDPESEA
jgi:regulatory protein RepA